MLYFCQGYWWILKEFNLLLKGWRVIFQISNGICDNSVSDIFQEMFCEYRFVLYLEDQCHQ